MAGGVLIALLAASAGVSPASAATATRTFDATFTVSLGTVLDANCFHMTAQQASGRLSRPGLPDWTFSFHGCAQVQGPLQGFSGALSIATPRGLLMTGT